MTYPPQGPNEVPPTVPNPVPGQSPPPPGETPPPSYPPGVASVPPPVDPYPPTYGTGYPAVPQQATPPYGQPGYAPGYGPPGYPPAGYPAPYAPPPKRRTGLIVGIIVGVLVLCLGGGAVAAILVLRNLDLDTTASPTDGPSEPSITDPTSDPTPGDPGGSGFSGDLRTLLLPRPGGAEPWESFPSRDGNLDLDTAADLFEDPAEVKSDLTSMNFRRGAANHWTEGDSDVLIILFQFQSREDALEFIAQTERDGIEDHDARGDFGNVPGSLTFVANRATNGKRSAIYVSGQGDIVSQVVVWQPNLDLGGTTALAVAQHERLP